MAVSFMRFSSRFTASSRVTPGSIWQQSMTATITRRTFAGTRATTTTSPLNTLAGGEIREKQVPVTVYNHEGGTNRYQLSVDAKQASAATRAPEPSDEVDPLTHEVYSQLPKTMRDISVFGKVAIVTGGARGLGNYMARGLAEAGAKAIALFDANQELGDAAAAELGKRSGLPVSFYKVDVRDEAAITAAVEAVTQAYGTPDVMVNSAGIAESNIKAETYDADMFRRQIDINLTGSFLTAKAVANAMMRRNSQNEKQGQKLRMGSIILVASMSGSIVNWPQQQCCYNASKAGVIMLAKSLAAEWASHGIRVNAISPGYMDTALNRVPDLDAQKSLWLQRTPQNRLASPDELNGLCVFLASDASKFVTGANMIIDGGYTLW